VADAIIDNAWFHNKPVVNWPKITAEIKNNIACNNPVSITRAPCMSQPGLLLNGNYPEWLEAELAEHFVVHRLYLEADQDAYIKTHAQNIKAIGTRGDLTADEKLIAALPALEIISVFGVGYDGVDVNAAKARNISISNTPDVLNDDVADLGIAMMLAHSRSVVQADAWVREGHWQTKGTLPLQNRVHGKRAGILGLGRIGQAVVKRLQAFDMDISYCNNNPRKDADADWTFYKHPVDLAKNSDFLFVTLTATPVTEKIVNADVCKALGKDGMLINLSRGSTVDETALLRTLSDGSLGFAALDVYNNEPNIDPQFLKLDNVLLQPHQGSATFETRRAMGKLVKDNLLAHLTGKPLLTPVN